MSEYRYSTLDNNGQYQEIDVQKLSKLDKLLVKIDNDLKKKQKEITKPILVETLKKTHEIYQIVLYEVSEMLENARLGELRQILTKIYNGQNNILNYILKLNTNFEVNADQMLQNLSKNLGGGGRRKSFGSKDADDKKVQSMAKSMVSVQPAVKQLRKTFAEKATDTADDMKDARDRGHLKQKEDEIARLAEELDEEGAKIDEFLKNRKQEVLAMGESKAQNNLRDVLKDLGKKRREADLVEEDANQLADMQNMQKNQMSALQGSLIDGLKGMQKAAQDKAMADVKSGKAVYKNGQLVYMETTSVETDKDYFESEVKERYDKLRRETGAKDQKLLECEKRIKDMNLEKDVLKHQVDELNSKYNQLVLDRKKQQDEKAAPKKTESTISKQDTDKIKRLVEDNIKMKLRIKTLLDSITDLEKEINRNFERFKLFVMNSNLPDDMKKALLAQAETLLKPNISGKLNLGELRDLTNTDSDLYRDPMFKNLLGSDVATIMREVKRNEQNRKAKMAKIPGYDPNFDPTQLEPDEKIITRKVKRMVERKNSRGEIVMVEEEFEEEVVINTKTGEEVRKREKPVTVAQSAAVKNFVDQHGGFAIGGAKITIPKRPVAKDGQEVKTGQWFEDKDGKKVRIIQGQNGEEVYEYEEQYVDENGVKRTRVKQVKMTKDKNGNDIVEEEIIGPDGKRQIVQKRVFKDKDGAQVTEEVITDQYGNKVVKRQKVIKDKDGNEVIVEEIIDQYGNKQVVKRKIVKDANGNDIVIEERIDANGNKIVTTIRKDEFGQDIVEQVITDKFGNSKRVEKQVIYDADGNAIVQETMLDENGKKIIKKTRMKRDSQGNMIKEEIITDEFGRQKVVLTKVIKDKDGKDIIEETIINADGTTTVVRKKVYKDKDGNEIIEEERVDANGNKVIVKTKKGKNGEETVEETRIGADGKPVKTVRTTKIDKYGNLVSEEQVIGPDGKITNVQRIKKMDKDGNEIIEEVITNPDGTKTLVRKKVYKDKDGNEIIEEERTDAMGNKVVVRTKRGKNGEETVEETRVGADGKTTKTIRQTKLDKNGNKIIEETQIGADGKKTVTITRGGQTDKQTQTDATQYSGEMSYEEMLDKLAAMGVDKSKLEQIRQQIKLKMKISENKAAKEAKKREESEQDEYKEDERLGGRNASADSNESLDTLPEDNEQDQAEKLYNKMMQNKFGGMADLIRQVRNNLGKQGNEKISLEEFQEYLNKMKQIHQKCGENCPHLRRFYEKLGFIQKKYKRRFLPMKDTKIEAKKKLPQIQTQTPSKQ